MAEMELMEALPSPTRFLQAMGVPLPIRAELEELEAWWEAEGKDISTMIDRMGTPWLRAYDRFGHRIDEILYPPDYRRMLLQGYRAGAVWRAFEGEGLAATFLIGYVTAFYDAGLYCPYTVSLATALALRKYGDPALQARFLPPLLRRDGEVWQGATWMTEAGGGSDLGATVETVARPEGEHWRLTGEKYFASNAGAELAVVAARPEGAPRTVRGLALFLLPRYREDGTLNYLIRRLKDKIGTRSVPTGEVELRESEAYLLGRPETGIYEILEVLNVSRVANSVGSVALMQRTVAEALAFAARRIAFGRPVLQHPLMRRQFAERIRELQAAFALTWATVRMLEEVWPERPPYPGALSPLPPAHPSGQILDGGAGGADGEVGDGGPRRDGGAGGVSGGALAAGGHDLAHLGRHAPPADPGRAGGDGAERRPPCALRVARPVGRPPRPGGNSRPGGGPPPASPGGTGGPRRAPLPGSGPLHRRGPRPEPALRDLICLGS